jgi:hypothetical protein
MYGDKYLRTNNNNNVPVTPFEGVGVVGPDQARGGDDVVCGGTPQGGQQGGYGGGIGTGGGGGDGGGSGGGGKDGFWIPQKGPEGAGAASGGGDGDMSYNPITRSFG